MLLALSLAAPTMADQVGPDRSIEIDNPGNQTVEIDVQLGGNWTSGNQVTAQLEAGGTVLSSSTISASPGTNETLSVNTTGLSTGTKSLSILAPGDETGELSITETRMITSLSGLSVDNATNSTTEIITDVGFNSSETATAKILLINGNGGTVDSKTVTHDPIEIEGTSGVETAKFSVDEDGTNYSVTVETTPADSYKSAGAQVDNGFFGAIGGIDSDTRLVVAGLAVAVLLLGWSRRD
jgi:hypothetical protein